MTIVSIRYDIYPPACAAAREEAQSSSKVASPDERQGEDDHAAACLSSVAGTHSPFHSRPGLRRNLENVSAQVLRHVAPFGAEYVLAGTMPEVGSSYRQQLGHVLLVKWPEEWVSRYFSGGYLFQDPTICRVKAGALPFFWKELDPSLRGDPSARRVMDEATEFHLKDLQPTL